MPESGGSFGFVEVGLSVAALENLFVDGTLQVPIYRRVNNEQVVETQHLSLGIGSRF